MKIVLTRDDARIISSAINWTIHAPFYRSIRPTLNEREIQSLESANEGLIAFIHGDPQADQVELERIDPENPRLIQVLASCIRAFDAEIGHSADEVKILTNVPASVLKELLARFADQSGI